jgi:DNA polymerase IIIc chi subunit
MIPDLKYTQSFIAAWLAEGARGRRFIASASIQQLGNVRQLLWERRHKRIVPHWCDLYEYVQAVRLLRKATREAESDVDLPAPKQSTLN